MAQYFVLAVRKDRGVIGSGKKEDVRRTVVMFVEL